MLERIGRSRPFPVGTVFAFAEVEMSALNALESGCLTVAAALAGTCAAAGTALASDSAVQIPAAPPALAITSAAAVAPLLQPSPELLQPPPEPPAPDAPSTDVRRLLTEPSEACAEPCVSLKKGPITDEIMRELVELPLVDTVMIPVTRGVTIETSDGTPAITLAVKPTKITRGSGLVAIKKF